MKNPSTPFDQKTKFKFANKINGLKPLGRGVIVTDMNFSGRKLTSGIILLGDDGKTDGIRPRWCRVIAVGSEQQDVTVGQWILVEHGRWTRGIVLDQGDGEFVAHRVDPDCIIMVSDEEPAADDNISTAVHAEAKTR